MLSSAFALCFVCRIHGCKSCGMLLFHRTRWCQCKPEAKELSCGSGKDMTTRLLLEDSRDVERVTNMLQVPLLSLLQISLRKSPSAI